MPNNIDELYEMTKDNFGTRQDFDAFVKEEGADGLYEITKDNFGTREDFDSFYSDQPTELPGKQSPDFTMGNLVGRKPSAQNPSSASQSKSAGSPSESQPPLSVAGRSILPANLDGKQLRQYAKQIGIPEVGLPDDAQLDKLAERLRGKSFFAAQLEFAKEKERQIRNSNAAKKEAGENRDARGLYEARKEVKKAYSGIQSALVYEQEQMKPAVEEASAILGQYETQLGELQSVFENESLSPEERNAAGQQFNELRKEAAAKYAEASPMIEKYNENQKALGSLGRLLPTGDEGARIRNSLDAYIKMNPYSPLNNSAMQGFSNAILPSFLRTIASVYDNEMLVPGGNIWGEAIASKIFDIADQVTITPSAEAEVSVFDDLNSENLQYTVGNLLGYMVPAMLSGGAMANTQQAAATAKVITGSQVYGNFYKEGLDAGLNKKEATLFAAVPTLVTAYFGDKGAEAMLAQLGKSATKQLIKESVKQMSGKSANEILDLSSKFANGFIIGALKEGTQEGIEQLSEMVSKDIANQTLEANFEGDYSIDGYLKGVGEAVALGAAVGAPLGGVSGITSRQNIIQSATQAATDPDAEKIYLDTIESMLAQGELGQADYDQALSLFQEAKKAVSSIPPTVQDEVDKEEATNLIIEQQTLNQQIEVTNPAMVAPLEARLAEVNTRLAAIADGKPREVISEVKPKEEATPLTNQASNTEKAGIQKTDRDIELRMSEIEGDPNLREEFSALEKEMESRERASVFDIELSGVESAIDALMDKEKNMPNGFGSFIEKRDARETKEVAKRYLNASSLSDAEVLEDFKSALLGNPDTWYADGLKLRESMNEASRRGINTSELISNIENEFEKDGYTKEEARSIVANRLSKILNDSNAQSNATQTGNVEQNDQQQREGIAGSQQGQQANRDNQEADVPQGENLSGGSNQPSESGAQQESQEVATIPPATDQGGQAPPSGGSGGTGRRTPPSDKQKESNRTRVRNIMERWARNREIKFQDFQGAEAIRRLGTYTQVSMEQANTIADALIDDVGIEAAMDISMDPEFAGNVRTAILGRNLNQLADKAGKKNTPENVTNLANAIIEFSIYGTNLGQALSQIRDVIESNPELFFVDSLRTKSSSINEPTMGDPTTTGTRAQVGLSARDAVEAAREAAFDEIMSALTNPLTPEEAMRQALEKAFELSGNDRAVLADMLKDLRDRGLLASLENRDVAVSAIYDALNGLNNQLENPLADADIRQIAETLIDTYEKIAAEKIKTEIGKILNTPAKTKGMRNEDKAIRALLYGALDDADYLEKWSMMFGGVSSAAFTAEEKAELKRLSELYAETRRQQGPNALATNSVNAQFKAYMNKAFIRQMAPGRKFRNRFIQAANLISGLRYNWILTAPTTLARVFSGTVESATTELASSMLADIVQGRPVAAKDAITKSFGNKQVVFTNAAGQQQAVELNRVLDNIYASIRGMPKMKAGGGQVFTEIEQLIRTNPKRATRVLLRALGVSAGRSMTAIDQLIIPITQYYTKSQVMYEIVKELYVQAGQDVKDPLVRAKITNDLESIMNGTPDQWGDALAQAQKDIMMGDLYKRSGLTAFPTTDPRKTKGVLSVEAKVYSEWLQRAYEIMDSKEAERLNKIATDGGWIGTMNPTQEMMALNAYLNAVTNSLTYTGLPRGTAGYLTDVVAKLAEKAPALQWAGVLPLFVNASGNFVAWTITNTPGINAIQLAKYYATGSRGAYRLKGSSEKELSQPGAVKVDQGKMAARVAITNAIFVATLLVNKALRGDDDDEREKFQESIMNGTYTGYTPVKLHPAFENKGYKGGWFYYKGKPIFAYKDGGLAPFFNAVAFIDNYDKFTPPGVVGFGKDVQPFREESPEFAEAIFEYSLLVGRTAMDQSMLVEFSKTIDDVNKILVAEEGTYSDKAVKSMTNAFAKFTRSYIPYSRLQENITTEIRENKPDPITFNQRVAAGTFLEQWAESSEKVDWFGRPIKSQMNYVSPFNLVSGAMNLVTEDNKAIKDDALIDLFLSKNYAPTNYPQQFVPLMVDQEDLDSKDIPSFAKDLEQSPEFKAERIGQIKLEAENVDASGKPTYDKLPFTLFLEPDEVKKVNTQKSVIAGDFIQQNIGKFRNLPDDVFADIMNQAYNIANKVAISKQIPQALKYMPDYKESIENSIRNFEAKYPNVGFEWSSKYK